MSDDNRKAKLAKEVYLLEFEVLSSEMTNLESLRYRLATFFVVGLITLLGIALPLILDRANHLVSVIVEGKQKAPEDSIILVLGLVPLLNASATAILLIISRQMKEIALYKATVLRRMLSKITGHNVLRREEMTVVRNLPSVGLRTIPGIVSVFAKNPQGWRLLGISLFVVGAPFAISSVILCALWTFRLACHTVLFKWVFAFDIVFLCSQIIAAVLYCLSIWSLQVRFAKVKRMISLHFRSRKFLI